MTASTALFLSLRFKDAPAGIAFLRDGLGFEPAASYAADDDPVGSTTRSWTGPAAAG